MSVLCIVPVHKPNAQNFISNLSQLLSIDLVDEVRVCASCSSDLSFLESLHSSKLVVLSYHSYGQVHQRSFAYAKFPIFSKYVLNLDQDISISSSALYALFSYLERNPEFYSCSIPCSSINLESFSTFRSPSPGFIYSSGYARSPSSNSLPVVSTWTKGGCTLWRSSFAANLFTRINLPRCTWSPCEDLIHSFTSHASFDHAVLFSHSAIHLNDRISGQSFSLRLFWKGLNIVLWRILFICIHRSHFSLFRLYVASLLRVFHVTYLSKICVNFGYLVGLIFFSPFVFCHPRFQQKILYNYITYFDRCFNAPD